MRTSQHSLIRTIVAPHEYNYVNGINNKAVMKVVGLAQNIEINDDFGTEMVKVIGNPIAFPVAGHMSTSISIQQCTINADDVRNMGAFNPLSAAIGSTYRSSNMIDLSAFNRNPELGTAEITGGNNGSRNYKMYPFMFILAIKNKVSNSYQHSNIATNNESAVDVNGNLLAGAKPKSNPFGIYACILQTARISLNSQNALVMDNVQALAKTVSGSWLTKKIKEGFDNHIDPNNGMSSAVYSIMHEYNS